MAESVTIYSLILVLCVWLTAATPQKVYGRKISNLKFFAIVSTPILVYTLFWGLRYNVGSDYPTYKYCFYFGNEGFEIGYSLFIKLLRGLGFSYVSLFILTSFLALFVIFTLSKERSKNYAIFSVYFFYTTSFVFFCQNGIRQSMAMWFIVLMLYSMNSNKLVLQTIVLGVIAWSLHKSALFPIAIILILKLSPLLKINKYVLMAALMLFTFYGNSFYELFLSKSSLLFEWLDYERQGESLGNYENKVEFSSGLGRILHLLIYCIVIFYQDVHLKKKNFDYYVYSLFLIGILVNPIIAANQLLGRMNVYFNGIGFLPIAYFVSYIYIKKDKNAVERFLLPSFVVVYFIFYITAILSNSNNIVPYRMIGFI